MRTRDPQNFDLVDESGRLEERRFYRESKLQSGRNCVSRWRNLVYFWSKCWQIDVEIWSISGRFDLTEYYTPVSFSIRRLTFYNQFVET